MASAARFPAIVRFWVMIALLGYQFAGASLVLPAELHCARCVKFGATGAVKAGVSCPLSYHGHDCHHSQGKTSGDITVCPDGCLRHNGQGGEIPSLAKFVSAVGVPLPIRIPTGSVTPDARLSLPDPFLPQSQHPPSTPL